MLHIWRSIHALLYETPGGLSGWLGRARFWADDRAQYQEWERDQRRRHESPVP